METLNYCVQCTDRKTNTIGDFAYDAAMYEQGKGFHALSPVFHSLIDFYAWAKANGWKTPQYGLTMTMVKA